MKLLITYPDTGNHGFNYIYDKVTKNLQLKYPDFSIERFDSTHYLDSTGHSPMIYSYGGGSNLSIVNLDTKKCIILSFADIAQHCMRGHGYDEFEIVEVYGGLSWGDTEHTPQEISNTWKIRYVPFQYPLPYHEHEFDEYLRTHRMPYDPSSKIRKAIFLGAYHPEREDIAQHLRGHPLFELPHNYYPLHEYWTEMSKYAMILSLNGNGEFCVRDIEGYALGIPTVRSEFRASLRYHPLIPNVHYIRGSEPSVTARLVYTSSIKEIAEQFVDAVEKTMYNDEFLINVSQTSVQYYERYCKFDYIADLFIELFEPEMLQ